MASCENGADGVKEEVMERRKKYDRSKVCIRCKINTGRVVIRHCVYCKDCFFPTVTLKFRRALESTINPPHRPRTKHEPLRADGSLVIGFSGGIGSAILLDTIWRTYVLEWNEFPSGSKKPQRPPVWNKVWVVYVEQASAFDGGVERVEQVRSIVSRYPGFELVVLRIEDAFDPSWRDRNSIPVEGVPVSYVDLSNPELPITQTPLNKGNSRSSPVDSLKHHLTSLPSLTGILQTVSSCTRLLLQYFALSTQSSHLLLGSSLTSLAISLILGISQGAGFNVNDEKEEMWKGCVKIVRPLRDVGWKECALWSWWRELEVASSPASWSGKVKKDSLTIPQLTKDFIVGLEKDYPSTVSTITKTCEKLKPKGESSGICVMCLRPAQAHVQAWKEQISIRQMGANQTAKALAASSPSNAISLSDHLCYACHTTLTSRGTRARGTNTMDSGSMLTSLPIWVEEELDRLHRSNPEEGLEDTDEGEGETLVTGRKMARDEMKEVINGFLLEE